MPDFKFVFSPGFMKLQGVTAFSNILGAIQTWKDNLSTLENIQISYICLWNISGDTLCQYPERAIINGIYVVKMINNDIVLIRYVVKQGSFAAI